MLNNIWDDWEPDARDLFFFDNDAAYCTKVNLTGGYNENEIKNIIAGCLNSVISI